MFLRVLPTPSLRLLAPFEDDPRLRRLLDAVQAAGVRIVAADADCAAGDLLADKVEVYPPGDVVFQFARQLARSL